ncbi:MAG: hypothetical protein ACE5IY_23065, partial [bacterium]
MERWRYKYYQSPNKTKEARPSFRKRHRSGTDSKGLEVLRSSSSKVYEYTPAGTMYFVVYKECALFFDENGLWDTVFPPDV